jgi:ubiquinone/menaquinone biosynthesis C-methylase UbiE
MTALEIGCGPGRLMLPLSETFGVIQGADVSGEMIALARENLKGIPRAEVRQNSGADLAGFADESVDFCYSFAVFQHIPDKEVVWSYLREACRVLKVGGILKFQCNGLPQPEDAGESQPRVVGWSLRAAVPRCAHRGLRGGEPDTWRGVSVRAEELASFMAQHNCQLLAMDRFDTQYLWVTARKRPPQWKLPEPREGARIIRVTDTFTGDAVVAQTGRYASATVWVAGLTEDADLNNLRVLIDGRNAAPCFIGKQVWSNPTQVNVYLPPGTRTGILPVELELGGKIISNRATVRILPAGPLVPRLVGLTDSVNLLSSRSIESRAVKVKIEEAPFESEEEVLAAVSAAVDGRPIHDVEVLCLDPLPRLYQVDLFLPAELPAGLHRLTLRLGAREFEPLDIEIAG